MFHNPFTPVFGGKPQLFFGRREMLSRFDLALADAGSEDRALFITGTRGSGKTALIEQLSMKANARGYRVIDLGPDDTAEVLVRSLVRHESVTRTVSPQASVSILGTGGSVSAGSVSKTTSYGIEDLQMLFLEACAREKHGILVTMDEVQKIAERDISAICNAFQMASRKGYDVILVVAGLPYAHGRVIHYPGCTYMRRAVHEELGLFSWDETDAALHESFAKVEDLIVSDGHYSCLNEASYGHPYLMQLLGYHLVLLANERASTMPYESTDGDVQEAVSRARLAYERRALRPMLDELSLGERAYLQAMGALMRDGGEGVRSASTSEIAERLGKKIGQLSSTRDRLISAGIIAAPTRGELIFTVPYLRTYVVDHSNASMVVSRAIERKV